MLIRRQKNIRENRVQIAGEDARVPPRINTVILLFKEQQNQNPLFQTGSRQNSDRSVVWLNRQKTHILWEHTSIKETTVSA